jgi:hypothetical protein
MRGSSGADQTRWPTAFVYGCGLLSLQATRLAAPQSSQGYNHQLESWMREIRQSGSEEREAYALPTLSK